MRYTVTIDGFIKIRVDKRPNVKIAAYLYKNRKRIEMKMYTDEEEIKFDYDLSKNSSGLFYIKVFFKDEDICKKDTDFFHIKRGKAVFVYKKTLLDIKNVLLESYIQDSNILFFTFNGARTTKESRPFGTDFILQNGWSCISVYQDNDTQYQFLSEELLYNTTKEYLNNNRVYTYGVSLGGYCAIYYGGILNATIISGSPRNSAHPSICIERFKGMEFKHKDINDTHKTLNDVFVMFDPNVMGDVNFINYQILNAYPNAKLLPLPMAGHHIFEKVLKLGRLKEFIKSVVEGNVYYEFNKLSVLNHNSN